MPDAEHVERHVEHFGNPVGDEDAAGRDRYDQDVRTALVGQQALPEFASSFAPVGIRCRK